MHRRPYFAGSFYPADQNQLRKLIKSFLEQVQLPKVKQPKMMIVPHAGYIYSGQIAAFCYDSLKQKAYSKVILIGCSHQAFFSGVALWFEGEWETPLGKLPIASELALKFINPDVDINNNTRVHLEEHTLEVQLPFLQMIFSHDFQILPILLGKVSSKTFSILVENIYKWWDDETLLIASSDLSHYPSASVAGKVDRDTIDGILTGEVGNLRKNINQNMERGYPGLMTCCCGQTAIEVAMTVAQKMSLTGQLLKVTHSGLVTKDQNQVVGYAGIIFN